MAYSNATIKKVYGDLQNLISYYGNKPAEEIKISISAGSLYKPRKGHLNAF